MTVRLSNPGNDADAYAFVASLDPAPSAGNVSWSTPTPTKSVAQGGSSFLTMSVTVDGDVPALEAFGLRLTATSLQNGSVSDSVLVPVAAAPDRSWTLNTSERPMTVLPASTIAFNVTAANTGNAADNFTLRMRPEVQRIDGDQAHGRPPPLRAASSKSGPRRRLKRPTTFPAMLGTGPPWRFTSRRSGTMRSLRA